MMIFQEMVFHNMFTLNSGNNQILIKDIVLKRLQDEQVEVRGNFQCVWFQMCCGLASIIYS